MTFKSLFLLRRPSIARRLLIYILLCSSLITLLATVIQLYFDYRSDVDILEARLNQIEDSFVESIADDLWNLDENQVRGHLEGILKLPDIQYLRVDPDDFNLIEVGEISSANTLSRTLRLSKTVRGKEYPLGRLTIVASLEGIYGRLKQRLFVVLVTQAIKTFIVCAFMLFIFNALIIKHLESIANYARHFSLRNLDRELELDRYDKRYTGDELDHVVTAFNQMREALKQSYQELLSANQELADHRDNLENLVTERTRELREAEQSLLENAHKAGMAEIAIGVLHHIGNTLNSLNISSHLIEEELDRSALNKLLRANKVLAEHEGDLTNWLQEDPKGLQLIKYQIEVGRRLEKEQRKILEETHKMEQHIKLMRDVIFSQQEYARGGAFKQMTKLDELMNEVIQLEQFTMEKCGIRMVRNFHSIPSVFISTNKVRYIFLHLLKNAREALERVDCERRIEVVIDQEQSGFVMVSISDNGEGIPEEDIVHIFNSGYTTKENGHGFGLHTCANAMAEMGGKIEVHSDGKGTGATFTLHFPVSKTPLGAHNAEAPEEETADS